MNVHPIKTILTREPWNKCSETIQTRLLPQKTCSFSSPAILPNLSIQHISWVWLKLTAIYGQLFVSKNGTNDSNGVWYNALKELTPKALESGMERLNTLSAGDKFARFPPNCLEFKALCLDFYNALKLPKSGDVYLEIKNCAYKKNPRWSHPIVKFIAMRLPHDFLQIERDHEAFDLFTQAYNSVCNLIKQGHAIPEITVDILVERKPDRRLAQTHLQRLRQHLSA